MSDDSSYSSLVREGLQLSEGHVRCMSLQHQKKKKGKTNKDGYPDRGAVSGGGRFHDDHPLRLQKWQV